MTGSFRRYGALSIGVLPMWLSPAVPANAQERATAPLFTLGSEDGSTGELFTRIGAVAVDRHGRIIVLDAGENRLVVFLPTGKRLQYVGRRGAGPGEFASPMALAVTASDRLMVLDPQTSRLTVYDVSRADSVRYVKDWPLPIRGYDMCAAGSRVFVLGELNERMIHEVRLDPGGVTIVHSFGEPKSFHPVAMFARPLLYARAHLACASDGSRLALVPSILGEIRFFRGDGEELLFTRLTPFQETVITQKGRAWFYSTPTGVFQSNAALLVDADGAATVEIITFRERPGERARKESYEFRSLSPFGQTRSVTPGHSILAGMSATTLACTLDDPYPKVLVYDRARLGGGLCP